MEYMQLSNIYIRQLLLSRNLQLNLMGTFVCGYITN